jgi:arsenite methyltransferase
LNAGFEGGMKSAGGMKLAIDGGEVAPSAIKQCCAAIYESDAARLLLGESFHPGGTKLTERLGQIVNLTRQARVLDVAAGKGTSATFLASRFGCEVVGIDFSRKNVGEAGRNAEDMGLRERVSFQWADAERLPFADESFDAVICECSFCTFPDKAAAAGEFARVLRVGGQVGLSDLTRNGAPWHRNSRVFFPGLPALPMHNRSRRMCRFSRLPAWKYA